MTVQKTPFWDLEHASPSSSSHDSFFPPKFNTLPVLRFWPNLVHLFFATFPRWVFRDFLTFPPPLRKNLVFYIFFVIFIPPKFNTLPVLRFWPNLVHLFFATFPRWGFRDFLRFLPPLRKNLVFYIFLPFSFPRTLTPLPCSDLDQTQHTYSLQHSPGGFSEISPPPPLEKTYVFIFCHFRSCSD